MTSTSSIASRKGTSTAGENAVERINALATPGIDASPQTTTSGTCRFTNAETLVRVAIRRLSLAAHVILKRQGNALRQVQATITHAVRFCRITIALDIIVASLMMGLFQEMSHVSLILHSRTVLSVTELGIVASYLLFFARRGHLGIKEGSLQRIASAPAKASAPFINTAFEMYDTIPSPARRTIAKGAAATTESSQSPQQEIERTDETFWSAMLAGLRCLSHANLWMASRRLSAIYDVFLVEHHRHLSDKQAGWNSSRGKAFEISVSAALDNVDIDRGHIFSGAVAYIVARYAEAADYYQHFIAGDSRELPASSGAKFAFREMLTDLQRRSSQMPDAVTWKTVSIVLPAYNEEQVIAETVNACVSTIERVCPNAEIIIVDDGSRDSTGSIIDTLAGQNACIRAIHNMPNRGYGGALRSGFTAIAGEYTFFMDSDGQFDPDEIRNLLEIAQRKPGSAVIGYRAKRSDPPVRRLNAWGWKQVTRAVLGLHNIRDIDCAFKLLPTAAIRRCALLGEGASINAEMLVKFQYMHVPVIQVPVTHKPREKGTPTGANLRVILRAFTELYSLRTELAHWKGAFKHLQIDHSAEVDTETLESVALSHGGEAAESIPPTTSWLRRSVARILSGPVRANDMTRGTVRALILLGAGLWVATRFGLVVFTFMTSLFEAAHVAPPTTFFPAISLQPVPMLKEWVQWDANWYILIATKGYWPTATAFFPLFPLLIHLGIAVTGAKYAWFVGMVINNLATLVGCIGIVFFAYQETHNRGDAKRTLLLLLCYPLAFFLAAPYTEGLLLATASWALWAMRRGNWWLAAVCVFLASVSRPTGFALYLPLLFEFFRQVHWGRDLIRWHNLRSWWQTRLAPLLAVAMSAPLGIGVFMFYCWRTFGDPLLWIHVDHTYFGRASMPLWESLREGFSYYLSRPAWSFMQFHNMTDFIPLVVMMILTIVLSIRQPFAFTLYMAALLYLTVASPQPVPSPGEPWVWYMSAGRYLLPSLPIWLALGRWSGRHATLETLIVYGGVLLQAVCVTQFLLGRWMV